MEILEITNKKYDEIIGDNVAVYNTSTFLELNAEKLHFIAVKMMKKRAMRMMLLRRIGNTGVFL